METVLILLIPALVAGLLTFLAPCTLPLIPAYLAFISGVSGASPHDPSVRRRVLLNGVSFVIGFSIIFVAFGALAGLAGGYLAAYRGTLSQVGGVVIIVFGLVMLGLLRIPLLQSEHRFRLPPALEVGKPLSSFLIGASFAFGWTPCVGPVLGSIILLASTSSTAGTGALLLAVFSLGLALPFIAVAAFFSKAEMFFAPGKWGAWVTYVGGAMLLFLGVLLATGNFGLVIEYSFKSLRFLNYEGILEYL